MERFVRSPLYYVYVVVVAMAVVIGISWITDTDVNWVTVVLVGVGCAIGTFVGRRIRAGRRPDVPS